MKINYNGISQLLKLYPQFRYAPDDGAGDGGAGGDAGGDTGGDTGADAGADAGAGTKGSADDKTKMVPQDVFNKEVGKIRQQSRKEVESYLSKFKEIQERLNLSESEKERIALDLEEIRSQNLTEVQKRDLEIKKWESRYQTDTEKLTTAAKLWQERFEQQQFHVAVHGAVAENKGFDPDQFSAILGRMGVKIKEVVVDERPTGAYDARVTFPDLDKENKPVMLDLTVAEAVKRMSDIPKYKNLFTPNMAEGTGLRNADSASDAGKTPDWKSMTPEKYDAWRKKNKDKVERL